MDPVSERRRQDDDEIAPGVELSIANGALPPVRPEERPVVWEERSPPVSHLEILMQEHDLIHQALHLLDSAAVLIERGRPIPEGFQAWVVDFLRNFADRCHHAKEEGVLFPALAKKIVGSEDAALKTLVLEHVAYRGYAAELEDLSLEKPAQRGRFVALAHRYTESLRLHIYRENNETFPAAMRVFTGDELAALLVEAREAEKESGVRGCAEQYASAVRGWEEQFYRHKQRTEDPGSPAR